jgi:hypothetical protein
MFALEPAMPAYVRRMANNRKGDADGDAHDRHA